MSQQQGTVVVEQPELDRQLMQPPCSLPLRIRQHRGGVGRQQGRKRARPFGEEALCGAAADTVLNFCLEHLVDEVDGEEEMEELEVGYRQGMLPGYWGELATYRW